MRLVNGPTKGLIRTSIALLIFVTLVARAAVNLLQTDAAAAFKAGDYERAEGEFAALLVEHPEDVTLLRYFAITLRKLERYQDSLTILQKALSLEPENVAVNYHTAVTLYKAGAFQAAVRSFNAVTSLAPESRYADLARQYIDTISDELARAQRPAAPEKFGIYGQVGLHYDSNLLATPDSQEAFVGDNSDTRYSGYLSGQYFFFNRAGWLGTADLSAYSATYDDDLFESFDINQINPGIAVQKSTLIGDVPAVNSVRYDYQEVELDSETYSESHVLTLMSRLRISQDTATRLTYRYTDDTFEFKGFDPAFSSRDADNHSISAINTWYLNDHRVELDLGVGYTDNNADGINFNYDAWQLETGARFALPEEWWLDLAAIYISDEYPDFAGPIERETDITSVSLSLRRWFRSSFLVQISAGWYDEDSNYDSLTYDRYNVGINFSYAY